MRFLLCFFLVVASTSANVTSVTVISGALKQLGYYAAAKKDCSPARMPEIRVVEAPQHGVLLVRQGILTTNSVANCPRMKVPTNVVLYQSDRRYDGPDRAVYNVVSIDGDTTAYTISIDVQAAPSGSSTPDPEKL